MRKRHREKTSPTLYRYASRGSKWHSARRTSVRLCHTEPDVREAILTRARYSILFVSLVILVVSKNIRDARRTPTEPLTNTEIASKSSAAFTAIRWIPPRGERTRLHGGATRMRRPARHFSRHRLRASTTGFPTRTKDGKLCRWRKACRTLRPRSLPTGQSVGFPPRSTDPSDGYNVYWITARRKAHLPPVEARCAPNRVVGQPSTPAQRWDSDPGERPAGARTRIAVARHAVPPAKHDWGGVVRCEESTR